MMRPNRNHAPLIYLHGPYGPLERVSLAYEGEPELADKVADLMGEGPPHGPSAPPMRILPNSEIAQWRPEYTQRLGVRKTGAVALPPAEAVRLREILQRYKDGMCTATAAASAIFVMLRLLEYHKWYKSNL